MSYWKFYYHFVWGTIELPLIDSILEPQLYGAIAAKALEMERIILAVSGRGGSGRGVLLRAFQKALQT